MADITWRSSDAYEAYMGRWSLPLAQAFLDWFAAPSAGRWLDVGCGTGALTTAVLAAADPSAVTGIDPSPQFLGAAKARVSDPRVRFEIGDAQALPVADDGYDAVVAGLVLNFVADPTRAAAEMARAARPGGAVGAYVWDFRGEMQRANYFWKAVAATDADGAARDPRGRVPMCQPKPLRDLFLAAGLDGVSVSAIDLPMDFRDFDDFWLPHTMDGSAFAQRYVTGLDEDRTAVLREQLRATLPFAADGSLHLTDRAWAVRGTKQTA